MWSDHYRAWVKPVHPKARQLRGSEKEVSGLREAREAYLDTHPIWGPIVADRVAAALNAVSPASTGARDDREALHNVMFAEWGRGTMEELVTAVLDAGFRRGPQWGVEFQDGEVWRADKAVAEYLSETHEEKPVVVSHDGDEGWEPV